MQYCIYLRKSRADADAEARGEGETLARHEKALLELSKKLRLNVTEIYREVVSGETIAARPVMQQLLSEVEKGVWDGVLVMEIERLARGDTVDQGIMAQTFKFSDTKIITPVKTYDPNNEFDEEYFEFGLFMSRREYKAINRRLQRGRLASVREGKYLGSRPPFGYIRKKLENDKGYTLEPHQDQADTVRMIFEMYTVGLPQKNGKYKRVGMALIVRKLNTMGIQPQRGEKWTLPSVRDMLINPVYIGKIRWNWRPHKKKMVDGEVVIERPRADEEECLIVDGLHEAIIDNETWSLAQEYISKNPPVPVGRNNKLKNPLATIVKCGKCGRTMRRRPQDAKKNRPDTLMCPAPVCDNVSSSLHLVEQRIIESLAKWLQDYKLQWESQEMPKQNYMIDVKQKALRKLDLDIKDLDKQLDNIHDFLEQGIYDTDTFLERSRIISERKEQATRDRKALSSDLEMDLIREASQKDIVPKVENLLAVYDSITNPAEKNKLLKEVLEKVVYTKELSGRWHTTPDNFNIVLYPRLPRV